MDKVFELLASAVQIFLWTWFITGFLGFKENKPIYKIGFCVMWFLGFSIITFLNALFVYDGFMSGTITLCYIIYSHFFLKGNFGSKLFICLFSTALVFTISTVVLFLISVISGFSTESLIVNLTHHRFFIICVCRVIEYMVYKFIIKINTVYKFTKKEWFLFILLPLFTWITTTLAMEATMQPQRVIPTMFSVALLMVGINIIIYFFMLKIKDDEIERLNLVVTKEKEENIERMAENIKLMFENSRMIKHDTEKHFMTVRTLATGNKTDDIVDYVDRFITKNISCPRHIFTDNDIFDSIISTYLEICAQKEIDVIVNIAKNEVKKIDPFDISVLFGNIFENAIEATEMADKKIIYFNVQSKKGYVNIVMENTFNPEHSNQDLQTSKSEPQLHGIGIKAVKKMIEEKEGTVDFYVNNYGLFCCDILYKA